MPDARIALALLVLTLSISGCTCGKAAPTKPEPYPPHGHHTGRMAKGSEPRPGPPTWRDSFDDGSFELVKESPQFELFPIHDDLLYIESYPSLAEVRSSPDGQRLTEMTLPSPPGDWQVERVWADEGCSPCVQLDKPRHSANPSDMARRYERAGDGWKRIDYDPRPDPPPPPPDKQLQWSRDRTLLIDDSGKARWDHDAGAPLPTVPDYSKKCRALWDYVGDSVSTTAIDGDTVYMLLGGCGPGDRTVVRFDDGVGRFLPPLPHPETFFADLHVGKDGALFLVGTCKRPPGGSNNACVFVFDGATWSDEGQHFDGLVKGSHAFARDDTLWIAVDQGRAGQSGTSDLAPSPAGALHRRSPDGTWQQLAFPRHELPGWTLLRFVPRRVALVDGLPWVYGAWYYVRKPDDDTLETRTHGALLRWKTPTRETGHP